MIRVAETYRPVGDFASHRAEAVDVLGKFFATSLDGLTYIECSISTCGHASRFADVPPQGAVRLRELVIASLLAEEKRVRLLGSLVHQGGAGAVLVGPSDLDRSGGRTGCNTGGGSHRSSDWRWLQY